MGFKNTQAEILKEKKAKEERDKILKERQIRNVRSRLNSTIKRKQNERDKALNSIRKNQEQNQEQELSCFDFLFSFGGLICQH